MARIRNPVGIYSPIGDALGNIAQVLLSGPSQRDMALQQVQYDRGLVGLEADQLKLDQDRKKAGAIDTLSGSFSVRKPRSENRRKCPAVPW